MTQEEKARRYDEALERAEALIAGETNTSDTLFYLNDIKSIFPELAESEDERIRKALLGLFKIENFNGYVTLNGIDVDDVITWLEKQAQSTTITIPKDLKGTDTDGGVVGERGEQGEKQSKLVDFDYNANDSDLQEVTYFIPNGFHAEIDGNKVVIKRGEQKPAKWSEEDEKITLSIEHVMNCASLLNIVPDKIDKIRAWLKSLKQRLQ